MKKVSLLVSLLAFIFIASVSTSYAQSTTDKVETEKAGITKSKSKPAAKSSCSTKATKSKCSSAKRSSCCSKSAKSKSSAKASGKNEDAVIEEKDKKK